MAAESFSKGNEAFVEENYEEAEKLYTSAIEQDEKKEDYLIARAQARIKLEKFKEAETDATKAIELNDQNIKAFLRKGVALFHLGEFESAKTTLLKGQALSDSDKNVSMWLRKCEAELDLQRKNSQGDTSEKKDTVRCTPPADTSIKDTASTPPPPAEIPMPTGPKTRYDWYQTETHVVITILVKNVKKEDLKSEIGDHTLSVTIQLPSGSEYTLNLDFPHQVCPDQSHVRIFSTKVEVKLKKLEGLRWDKLEGEPQAAIKQFTPAPPVSDVKKYPSSSQHTRDWDKLVADITKEEKEEKPEGDAALNSLFQQIYSDGSDEVKKAMNKSFMESGGTVLSTNWNEIAAQKTEVKPPDGMEYKKYS